MTLFDIRLRPHLIDNMDLLIIQIHLKLFDCSALPFRDIFQVLTSLLQLQGLGIHKWSLHILLSHWVTGDHFKMLN